MEFASYNSTKSLRDCGRGILAGHPGLLRPRLWFATLMGDQDFRLNHEQYDDR